MHLLLIEDDAEAANYLIKGLKEKSFVIDHASDGKQGLYLAVSKDYDVMIIDRMLPLLDGIAIIKSVRAAGKSTPALILSTLGEVDDRVEGLQAGADDYLAKPFVFSELVARIDALLRRSTASASIITELKVGDLRLVLLTHTARRSVQVIELQPREFIMLEYLMRNAGHVVTRTMLFEHVWDYQFDPQTLVLDVLISRLRGKIDRGFIKSLLDTVRGSGYMINETR